MRSGLRALALWTAVGATLLANVAPAGAVPPGSRDSTFSGDGLVGFTSRYGAAMGAIGDGGLATAIYRDSDYGTGENATSGPFRIIRYGPAGQLLPFANGGRPLWQYSPEGLSIPRTVDEVTGGKLLVVGAQITATIGRLGLARLNANGSYDTSFSGDGRTVMKVFADSYDLVSGSRALELDAGRVAVVVYGGNYTSSGFSIMRQAIVRLNPDGSLDTTLAGDGSMEIPAAGGVPAIEPDGTIYLTRQDSVRAQVSRYTPDGQLDLTFANGGGITSVPCGGHVLEFLTTDSSRRAVLACLRFPSSTTAEVVLWRFTTAGSIDATFGTAGKSIVTLPMAGDEGVVFDFDRSARWWMAARDPVGPSGMVNIVRTSSNGVLDPSFSGDGRATTTLPWTVHPFDIEVGPTRAFVVMQRSTATTAIMAIAS